jgi:hypothetical protein
MIVTVADAVVIVVYAPVLLIESVNDRSPWYNARSGIVIDIVFEVCPDE